MNIDKPLLHRIAHLSRLEVHAHNEVALVKDLTKIISWIEKLEEINTKGVLPLVTMSSECNVLQEDIPQAPLAPDKGLAVAPTKDTTYFKVPQVKK